MCESPPPRPDGRSWQGELQRLPPADGRRTRDGEEESERGKRRNKQEEQQKEPSRSSSILESTHLQRLPAATPGSISSLHCSFTALVSNPFPSAPIQPSDLPFLLFCTLNSCLLLRNRSSVRDANLNQRLGGGFVAAEDN